MTDIVSRACEALGVDRNRVDSYAIRGESIRLVIDNGIKGSPLYEMPLADLEADPEPDDAPAPVDLDLEAMTVAELKEEARSAGIPNYSRMKKATLIKKLQEV